MPVLPKNRPEDFSDFPEVRNCRGLIQRLYEIAKQIRGQTCYQGKNKDLLGWKKVCSTTKAYRDALKILEQHETLTNAEKKFLQDYVRNHIGHSLGRNPGDYWSICTKPFKGTYFAVYPEAICVKPILSSCPKDGVVLDPMCGSGTTCVVAKKLGRNYIGIEIVEDYCRIAQQRLQKQTCK